MWPRNVRTNILMTYSIVSVLSGHAIPKQPPRLEVGKAQSRILVKFELVMPMAPALRKTKRASEVAKRCSCLHPTSQLLTSLGRGKWTTSN